MRILVNIDVPDLARATDFYCAALGVRLNRTLDDDVAELVGGAFVIYLLQKAAGSQAVATRPILRDFDRHWTPVHLDFVVDDIAAAERRALDAGARRESGCVAWRGSRCITFSDPFGNGFCLIAFDAENDSYV